MKIPFHDIKFLKALAISLKLLAIVILVYLLGLPFYPELKYYFADHSLAQEQEISQVAAEAAEIKSRLPESEYAISPDRLIIPKIGVNAPIIVSNNEQYGLSLGAWLVPIGSTPDKGGNTVLTGHRFKYLPPSNLTFYLFHKLKIGDVFSVTWKGKDYFYKVKEIKVVEPSDSSPYNKSEKPILTMYTCTPIYSTAQRLVIISELIENE